MREWGGIQDDKSDVGGESLSSATGVSFTVEGELRRRPGLSYLAAYGGNSLATFRSPVTGSWLLVVESDGEVQGLRLSTAAVTALASGYNVEKPANNTIMGPRLYLTNDFDRPKVWDGVWSALRDAGIAAPGSALTGPNSTAAGVCTAGVHLIRYRFVDSTSPAGTYRSNASTALSYTVVGGSESLTFTIGAAATNIIRSTDPKVDTIVMEMTLVDGSVYFVATTCANTATSVTVNISDTNLALADAATLYGETGHEQPPIGAVMFECRNITFLCGFIPRTRTVGVTNGNATVSLVSGGNFSTLWTARLIRIGTDSRVYEILSATASAITLTETYAGSTSASVSATIISKSPNRAYWTPASFPESWKAATRAKDVLTGNGDRVVGGTDFMGDAWFFGQRSMSRLVFVDDPGVGELVSVPGFHGLWNQRCLIGADGALYGWGPNGAWSLAGGRPRWISRPIDTTVAALLDTTKMDQALAEYDPVAKTIRWRFVVTGESVPRYSMVLDLNRNRWSIDRYRQGIDAAVVIADDNGRLRLVVSDATNGRVWYHNGATDGVPAASTGAYSSDAGATTTVIPMLEALPTGAGTDLAGVMLYRPATGEERVIASNTATTVTISTALSTAPSLAEVLYAGAIPWSITTDWWVGRDLATKKRPHLHLLFSPSTTGSVRVKVYRDFSETAHTWTSGDGDRWPSGVTLTNGLDYLTVDLSTGAVTDGFVPLPMPAEWSRVLKAEVTCLSPAGTLRILDVRFVIEDSGDEGKDTRE